MARTFDEAALLETVGDDVEFLAETVQMLGTDGATMLAELRQAVLSNDAAVAAGVAHKLKGMISNFSAPKAQQSAAVVEKLGRAGDLSTGGEAAVAEVERDYQELLAELEAFVGARR